MNEPKTSEHCVDCCCARAWKALGIDKYTGLSIPEHIEQLRVVVDLFLKQWDACGPNSDFGRYFQNVRDAALKTKQGNACP
jgi:hypothetical protein